MKFKFCPISFAHSFLPFAHRNKSFTEKCFFIFIPPVLFALSTKYTQKKMARFTYPDSIPGWIKLFRLVKPAVIALATPNLIDTYMTENSVVLTDDETAANDAEAAKNEADKLERDGEKFTEEAKTKLIIPKKNHLTCVQALKAVYATNVHKLGDWGVTVNNISRIDYKPDTAGHPEEMQTLITKHNTFAVGTSPLISTLTENHIDLAQNSLDIAAAVAAFANAKTAHDASETKNELAMVKMMPVIKHLRGIGQAAIKMWASTPHKVGDLGYTIDASKQPPKVRTIVLDKGEIRELKKIDVGSFIIIEGDGEVAITSLSTQVSVRGTRSIANKDKPFLVTRGFGSCRIENLSSDKKVTIIAEFNH